MQVCGRCKVEAGEEVEAVEGDAAEVKDAPAEKSTEEAGEAKPAPAADEGEAAAEEPEAPADEEPEKKKG